MRKKLGHLDEPDSVPLRSQGTRGRGERLADPSLTKHYGVKEAKGNLKVKVKVSLSGAGGRPREPWPRGMGGSGFMAMDLSAQKQFLRGSLGTQQSLPERTFRAGRHTTPLSLSHRSHSS